MKFKTTWKIALKKFRKASESGAALVVALFVILILVLISLTLFMQSDSEYGIALNEQDALKALSDGEAALQWAKREIYDYSVLPATIDFTELLNGPDNADAGDDGLLALRSWAAGHTSTDDLNAANEETDSVIVSMDFGDGTRLYEAFRMGIDTNEDDSFDGNTRTLVYVRIFDNYDANADVWIDTDQRIGAEVVTEYPILVDGGGNIINAGTRMGVVRGVAKRRLLAKFGPVDQKAILTDGSLDIHGGANMQLCGECGGAHANETMDLGDSMRSCAPMTGTGDFQIDSGVTVPEGSGFAPYVPIPKINIYNDFFVPVPLDFDHSSDTELAAITELQCDPWDATTNPGGTKYFALVMEKQAGAANVKIFKAYWEQNGTPLDNADDFWRWRLIDDSNDGNLNTVLDNCGRVVSGTVDHDDDTDTAPQALSADPCTDPIDCPSGVASRGVVDGGSDTFYGFEVDRDYNDTGSCAVDETLETEAFNNFVPSGNPPAFNTYPIHVPTGVFGTNTLIDIPPLPGTSLLGPPKPNLGPDTNPTADGFKDWDADIIWGNNDTQWDVRDVYAPMYHAVVFIFGSVDDTGNNKRFYYVEDGAVATTDIDLPGNHWRVSLIVDGETQVGGAIAHAPADSEDFPYAIISSRDISYHGNAGQATQCDMDTGCFVAPAGSPGFEGAYLTHEQVRFTGDVGIDGYVVAEDAARCYNAQQINDTDGISEAHGSASIHYDCENPPNPFQIKGATMLSWEEVQLPM